MLVPLMSDALFDVPADAYVVPPAPEQLTRAENTLYANTLYDLDALEGL